MAKLSKKTTVVELEAPAEVEAVQTPVTANVSLDALAAAFVAAMNAAKPVEKKTAATRKVNTPWTPKDGSPRLKLKRKMYHHGLPINDQLFNEEIDLLNKIKPGVYCEGHVRVIKRHDKGLDIDYPIRTSAQRLKLVNQFGIRNFAELLKRLSDESQNPAAFITPEEQYDE